MDYKRKKRHAKNSQPVDYESESTDCLEPILKDQRIKKKKIKQDPDYDRHLESLSETEVKNEEPSPTSSETFEHDRTRKKKKKKQVTDALEFVKVEHYNDIEETDIKDEIFNHEEDPLLLPSNSEASKPAWNQEDKLTLLNNIIKCLPSNDKLAWRTRELKLDWELIKFSDHNAQECAEVWKELSSVVRHYRLLEEIVNDVHDYVKDPQAHKSSKNQNSDEPRKPQTPFMLYYLDNYKAVLKENPGMNVTKAAKIISEKFKNLSSRQLEQYQLKHKAQKEAYDEQMILYRESHPEWNERKSKSKRDKLKPPSAYNLFAKTCSAKWTTMQERSKAVSELWSKLSPNEKLKYKIESDRLQKEYYLNKYEEHSPTDSRTINGKTERSLSKFQNSSTNTINGRTKTSNISADVDRLKIEKQTNEINNVLESQSSLHAAALNLFQAKFLSTNPTFQPNISLDQQIMDQWELLSEKKKKKYIRRAAKAQ